MWWTPDTEVINQCQRDWGGAGPYGLETGRVFSVAGITCLGRKLYVLSGHDGDNSFYHSIEEYSIPTDTWSELSATTLPYGRSRFGCVALYVPPI